MDVAQVTQIERNIRLHLSDQNYLAPKGVSNANLIEDIWIATRAIAYHDLSTVYQRDDILNDRRIFPDLVGPAAPKARRFGRFRNCAIHRVKRWLERHHNGNKAWLDPLWVRNGEDSRLSPARPYFAN